LEDWRWKRSTAKEEGSAKGDEEKRKSGYHLPDARRQCELKYLFSFFSRNESFSGEDAPQEQRDGIPQERRDAVRF
jgi:hypothetical protein